MDYLLLALVFVLVSGLTFSGSLWLARRRQRMEQRLRASVFDEMDEKPALVLGDLTPAFSEQVPLGKEDRTELQKELRIAGYYRPTALTEYTALRTLLILVPLLAAGVLALFVQTAAAALYIWGGGLLAAGLGWALPRVYLYYRGQARMHAIERGLPVAIDMLTLSLGAGLNVLNSLHRVSEEVKFAFPILGEELQIVGRQAELKTLDFALAQFADRVGLPQVRNLSVILSQSENLGTDAVTVLREYADNMRTNMRQRADEMANKAPFKMLFPAYLLAIGACILLIAPTVLEFAEFRRNALISTSIKEGKRLLRDEQDIKKEAETTISP
jgi:tight adherence protein C